jgi:hypothetical protein
MTADSNARAKFRSFRTFDIYSYGASHGLLLFRSRKTNENTTRIDILIQDVRAMELRCWSHGIEIEETSPDYLLTFKSNPAAMIEPGNKVYSVRGNDWQGFIVGGLLASHEDDGDFSARSKLLGPEHA